MVQYYELKLEKIMGDDTVEPLYSGHLYCSECTHTTKIIVLLH